LHPSSLPSGQLDEDVFRWLDFLQQAGQSVWQFLPLGIPSSGLSPYQCLSAFAVNPALFPAEENPHVNVQDSQYQMWAEQQAYWLNDFVHFMLLKSMHHGQAWFQWPDYYRDRHANVLRELEVSHRHELNALRWQQYCLHQSWMKIRQYAHEKGIYLFGDMPIFVAHDSADVWASPQNFLLDHLGMPTVVTGVPPDYFSETGQRWGNPHYDWESMQSDGFCWWKARIEHHFAWFDIVRIDHFRGLQAAWVINADCETAVDGHWQEAPGSALLQQIQEHIGQLPLVAEDLGVITEEVVALRKQFHLPGMAVLQFSFDAFDDNPHKPQNIQTDTVVYSGTHDNDTSLGWFNSLSEHEQQHVMQVLQISDANHVVPALLEQASASQANLSILPLQDLLGLGSEARMNTPGTTDGNWLWQFCWDQINSGMSERLKQISIQNNRLQNYA